MRCTDLRVGSSPAAAAGLFGATNCMSAPLCTFNALATWSVATCEVTRHAFAPHGYAQISLLRSDESLAQDRGQCWPHVRHYEGV